MQGVGLQGLARGLPRDALQAAPAPGDGDRDDEHAHRRPARLDLRSTRGEPAHPFVGDGAESTKKGRLGERREGLDLAVPVLMLRVRGLVRGAHRDQVMVVEATSSRLCAASEISASEPVAIPAAPLASVMPALAAIDQRAARSLHCSGSALIALLA